MGHKGKAPGGSPRRSKALVRKKSIYATPLVQKHCTHILKWFQDYFFRSLLSVKKEYRPWGEESNQYTRDNINFILLLAWHFIPFVGFGIIIIIVATSHIHLRWVKMHSTCSKKQTKIICHIFSTLVSKRSIQRLLNPNLRVAVSELTKQKMGVVIWRYQSMSFKESGAPECLPHTFPMSGTCGTPP